MKKSMMTRSRKVLLKSLAGVCVVSLLAGCGGSKYENAGMAAEYSTVNRSEAYSDGMWSTGGGSYKAEYEEAYDSYTDADYGSANSMSGGAKADQVKESSNTNRKLIKTVNMNVETQEFDLLMTQLETQVKECGGYIQNLDSYNGSSYSGRPKRYANLVIRIPQADLDRFVGSISDLANIVNRSENVDDITLTYVDLKSHKESLQVEQERLLALLDRAEYLEDIITLENRLTNVRYQIESMESQLRTYDDQVDYSTVHLRIDEVQVYTPVEQETALEKMSRGLQESLEDIRDGFVDFGIWFVVSSPYLVIWAIVIGLIVLVLKKLFSRKKGTDKKNGGKMKKAKKNNQDVAETEQKTTEEKENPASENGTEEK